MQTATAILNTAHAKKYLGQLCKHFAHKVEVKYSDTHGECALPPGPATMDADETTLRISITAPDEDGLKLAKFIIDSHLKKFAFREGIEGLDWLSSP